MPNNLRSEHKLSFKAGGVVQLSQRDLLLDGGALEWPVQLTRPSKQSNTGGSTKGGGGLAEQERDRRNRKGTGGLKGGSSPAPSLQDETLPKRPPEQPSFEAQLKQANDRAEKAERARDELASKLELAEKRANAATRDAGIAAARATRLEQTVESERKAKAALAAALNGKVTAEAAVHLVGARILEDSKPNGGLGKVSTSLLADVGRYALPSLGLTQKDIEDLVEEAKKKAEEQAKKEAEKQAKQETKKEAEATCSNGWSESDTFLNHANHAEVKRRQAAARQHLGLDVLQQPFAAYQAAIGGFREEKPKRGESWTAQEKKSLRTLLNAVARSLCAHLQYGDGAGLLHVAGGSSGTFQVQDPKTGTPVATVGQVLPLLCLKAAPPTER